MIQLGNYNTLEILRSTSVGLFLGDEEGTEILLPNKYVPDPIEIGQKLTVFCYLDSSERNMWYTVIWTNSLLDLLLLINWISF
jgi:predicted RNA-binding protein (virulence factor B family)